MKTLSVLLLVSIVLTEVLAMSFLTQAGKVRKFSWTAAGILGYTSVGILFAALMRSTKGRNLAFSNSVWNAGTVVITAMVAVTVFSERLNWPTWIGVGLAVAAIGFLAYGEVASD